MTRYTKELLQPVVAESRSMAEVVRKLGLRPGGGSQSYLRKVVDKFCIDTSHFTGQGWAKGIISRKRLPWQSYLVKHAIPIRTCMRRRAMIESGIPYLCEECGQEPEWRGNPLVLQTDHRDGDQLNDERENLRFLCPNCHTQTANFGIKNRRTQA